MFTIHPTITGAIIGAFSAWALSFFSEKYRFNHKKKGTQIILKSEIESNLANLIKFKNSYLNTTSKELHDKCTLEDISDFYYYLSKFPVISHSNWDRLISFIPDIYEETEIKQIIEFNAKLDDLQNQSKILYEKGMPQRVFSGLLLYELEPDESEVTLGTYESYENKVNSIINDGKTILNTLK